MSPRPFCAELSAQNAEPLQATASRIEHWLLVEYRGRWGRDLLPASGLTDTVKAHIRKQLSEVPRSRVLFIRRPRLAGRPGAAVSVYVGRTGERDFAFRRIELEAYEDLLTVDLGSASSGEGEPLDHPLFVVCTHGKRDRCCARYGRPLYDAVREQVDSDWAWQSSHVGGDRFAGTLVCFPEGLYFGRVDREHASPLLDDYLAGRIYLDRFRGRSCYPFPVQAAEHAVRRDHGLRGIDDLRLVSVEQRALDEWTISFRGPAGTVYVAVAAAELGDLTYLTCGASSLQRPRRFVATSLPAGR